MLSDQTVMGCGLSFENNCYWLSCVPSYGRGRGCDQGVAKFAVRPGLHAD